MPEFTAGAPSLVNTTTAGDQAPPLVAGLATGGVAVAWYSTADQGMYLQQFDAAGGRVGGETLLGTGTVDAIVGVPDGIVVLYTQGTGSGSTAVSALHVGFSGQPIGAATVVASSSNATAPLQGASLEALPGGGWLATWEQQFLPPSPQQNATLFAQRFDAAGAAAGDAVTVTSLTGTIASSVAVLPDGEWTVAYSSFANFHDGIEAFTQQFSASGVAEHANTINPNPAANEVQPDVAVLADGRQAVVWFTPDGQPTWYHLQAQFLDASGAPAGAAFDLSTPDGLLAGLNPQVTALADGGFVVTWEHVGLVSAGTTGPSTYCFGVQAQYFDAAGHAAGGAMQVGPSITAAAAGPPAMQWTVTATADGGFAVALDERSAATGLDVYLQKFSPAPAVQAGTAGDDALPAGSGNARIDGGAGTDTVVFDGSIASVQSYSIANGVVSITTARGTDTLVNVERVRFSDGLFALDTQAPAGSDPGGHAWQAAAVYHAVFGTLPGAADLGRWTADADHAGSMGAMAQHVIDAYAPGVSSSELVTYLYRQLAHAEPSAQTVQSYADQVGPGLQFATQGDLLAWAASLPANAAAIAGIVGSAQALDPSFF